MDLEEEVLALKSGAVFRGLDEAKIRLLAMTSDHMMLETGETVYQKGELSDAVYFILQGEADLSIEETTTRHIARIGSGALFGDVEVLAGNERGLSATAASELSLLRIDKNHFMRLLRDNAQLSLALAKELARRLEFVVTRHPDLASGLR